jgi:light-regulated signal transduction histidine kinase (bacteriophytochrome)
MLILAEDNEMVTQAVNDGIAANMHWEVEYRIRHKDGSIRFAFEKGTVIKNDKNEVLYLDGFILDITDRKKSENEIKSLLKITEEQNSRLKNFAHIVSHNLRSHSSGMSGLLELIEIERPEIFNFEMMLLLKMGAENLKQTIEDLTEVVKVNLDVDELYEINLNSIIENNINSLSSLINNAGIKIINEISHEVKVKGIMAYMNSIALNMITNAIKYKSEERQSFLRIFCKEDESFITLYFQDNGLGIDLIKYGDKLFGMYKTFHRHHDARGVGLFITKYQVESMGGKIMVESEVNIGTTFKIIFKK